jgi:hypothetical protein
MDSRMKGSLGNMIMLCLAVMMMIFVCPSAPANGQPSVGRGADSTVFYADFEKPEIDLSRIWHREGEGTVQMSEGRLALQDTGAGVVLWIRQDFPPDVRVQFDLSFSNNQGIGVFFLAAIGVEGEDILTDQPGRNGDYSQYTNGIINCYGFSLHRFFPDGEHNPGSNIRKNRGFHQVNHVEKDPVIESNRTYSVRIEKVGGHLCLWVDGDLIHNWIDDGTHGPPLEGGKIGFRLRGDRSCVMFLDNIVVNPPAKISR